MRCILSVFAIMIASSATAQSSDWTFSATLYAWAPETGVSVETPLGTVEGELSFSDAWEALDFAFMGAFTAQRGRFGLVADFLYFDLNDSNATPGPVFSEAKVETLINVTNTYLTYEVLNNGPTRIDLGIGARFYSVESDVTLTPASGPDTIFSDGDNWVDPLIAVRYRGEFAENWFGTVLLDTGGFFGSGSDFTWQGLATLGYRFNDRFSVQAGYRYLQSDRIEAGGDVNLTMSGPVIGLNYTF